MPKRITVAELNTLVAAQGETIQKLVGHVLNLQTRVEALEAQLPTKLTGSSLTEVFEIIGFTHRVSEQTLTATDLAAHGDNWFISVDTGYYHENTERMQAYIRLISDSARAKGHFTRIERENTTGRAYLRVSKSTRSL